jgi:hypothetical protein
MNCKSKYLKAKVKRNKLLPMWAKYGLSQQIKSPYCLIIGGFEKQMAEREGFEPPEV